MRLGIRGLLVECSLGMEFGVGLFGRLRGLFFNLICRVDRLTTMASCVLCSDILLLSFYTPISVIRV